MPERDEALALAVVAIFAGIARGVDVAPGRDAGRMTDDEVLRQAAAEGFALEERVLADRWVWGWVRGDDTRWPCYLTRGEALRWMADRLNRGRIFA